MKSFVQGAGLSIFCSLAGLVSDLGSLNPTVALAINAVKVKIFMEIMYFYFLIKRQIVKDQIPSNENVDLDPITDSLPSFFFAPIIGGIVAVIIHRFLIEKSLDLEQKEGGLEEPLNP